LIFHAHAIRLNGTTQLLIASRLDLPGSWLTAPSGGLSELMCILSMVRLFDGIIFWYQTLG
jgi:hypothetical protein